MTGSRPEPTASELATLALHITAWGSRSRVQQAICLAILRGHRYVPDIARYLRLGKPEIESALEDLIGEGLLWDVHKLLLH